MNLMGERPGVAVRLPGLQGPHSRARRGAPARLMYGERWGRRPRVLRADRLWPSPGFGSPVPVQGDQKLMGQTGDTGALLRTTMQAMVTIGSIRREPLPRSCSTGSGPTSRRSCRRCSGFSTTRTGRSRGHRTQGQFSSELLGPGMGPGSVWVAPLRLRSDRTSPGLVEPAQGRLGLTPTSSEMKGIPAGWAPWGSRWTFRLPEKKGR